MKIQSLVMTKTSCDLRMVLLYQALVDEYLRHIGRVDGLPWKPTIVINTKIAVIQFAFMVTSKDNKTNNAKDNGCDS